MVSTMSTSTLTWNKRKKRLEGTYRGVKMERSRAYQFQVGSTILTVDWDGTMDQGGEPVFYTVDNNGGNANYGANCRVSARFADWFEALSQIGENN